MSWYQVIQDKVYKTFRRLVSPLVNFFAKRGTPPWAISLMGMLLTLLSFILMYRGWMRVAGGFVLFAALWDTLDGEVARLQGSESKKGAFLDSVLDRFSEFTVFLGFFLFLNLSRLDKVFLFALLFSSLAVSYIRARAEGIGIECKVGIFDRPLRVTILGIALVIIPDYMEWVLRLLLVGTSFTAVHRFVYVLTRKKVS
ncbi:CDP-alcohol phosphatidyltransferase family protein [bacterium]|nr:CDP-alcohol phosphatidyltransferase family protein [bacterium]